MIYGVIEYNYTVPLTQQFESLIYFHGLLLTLAYLNPTDSDLTMQLQLGTTPDQLPCESHVTLRVLESVVLALSAHCVVTVTDPLTGASVVG